jgi:predicted ATPase/DNA-binding SARP family transcriptional activator
VTEEVRLGERWRIELLGGLRAVQGDRIVTHFRTQKTGLLLAYLAFHATPGSHSSRSFPREQLMELLWPEVERRDGLNHLKATLHWLRQELEPPGVPFGAVLRADRTCVGLDPAAVTTDVAEFAAALEAAARVSTSAERANLIAQAVELYRGELLPGCHEAWVLLERPWLAERFFQALGELLSSLEGGSELERALTYARQGVRADPLREEAHLDLIRLLAAAGQPAAALRQYDELERRLARDLDEEPSDESRALGHTLRTQVAGASTAAAAAAPPEPVPSVPVGRLPLPLDRFFGRRSEMAQLIRLLRPPSAEPIVDEELHDDHIPTRLITLTGPGGSGKTRLALEVARRLRKHWQDNVWFVPLADLTDGRLIPDQLRDTLGLPRPAGVDPLDQAIAFLNRQPSVVVLDNLEHLPSDAVRVIQSLLERTPGLTLLATSRRRLGLAGEREFPVAPLPVPADVERSGEQTNASRRVHPPMLHAAVSTLSHNPSVALFVDRARAVKPDFAVTESNAASVAELCMCLEGLPLALELAAARIKLFTPGQMVNRMATHHPAGGRLAMLVNRAPGAVPRHNSLRTALDWSFHLLTPELRAFFPQLAVFRGGFTLEAAERVCGQHREGIPFPRKAGVGGLEVFDAPAAVPVLDYLDDLCACSLIQTTEEGGETRYRLLESMRNYGFEQLTAEELAALQWRHAGYFQELAEEAEPHFCSSDEVAWFDRMEREHDNFRASLAWSLEPGWDAQEAVKPSRGAPLLPPRGERLVVGVRLAAALHHFWNVRCFWQEARDTMRVLVSCLDEATPGAVRADALSVAAYTEALAGDADREGALAAESLAVVRAYGHGRQSARALASLAMTTRDPNTKELLLPEIVHLSGLTTDSMSQGRALLALAVHACDRGEYELAAERAGAGLQIFRQMCSPWGIAMGIINLADIRLLERDFARAGLLCENAMTHFQQAGDRHGMAACCYRVGMAQLELGATEAAETMVAGCLSAYRDLNQLIELTRAVWLLGRIALVRGQAERAAELFLQSHTEAKALNDPSLIALCLEGLAAAECRLACDAPEHTPRSSATLRHAARSVQLFAAAERLRKEIQPPLPPHDLGEQNRYLNDLHRAMDPVAFSSAWNTGWEMGADHVIEQSRNA